MSLNYEADKTYHQFDSAGMLVVKDDPESWKDSIGRTVLAWIAYGKPYNLGGAVHLCWQWRNKYILYRHPDYNEKASRDHWSYFIIFLKLSESSEAFKNFIYHIPPMRGMNLWMKSLTGNKRAEWWYYFWAIPCARIGNGFLRFSRWAGRIGLERDNKWWVYKDPSHGGINNGNVSQYYRTFWQNIWGKIILNTIPAFALHIKAWQLYVMPASRKKEKLKRILLSRIGISNIMLRLLLGDTTVTQKEIDNYPHMTGYRPGVYLDETCRRDIRELDAVESEFNAYEKFLIEYLWNEKCR